MKFKFSIVVPVLNEGKNINELCEKLIVLLRNKYDYEIIFVDDGSTDNTVLNIKKRKEKNIFVIHKFSKPIDLSKSCRLGINKSKFNNILIMDGDLQHDPKYIPKFIELFVKYDLDIVVGTRDFKRDKGLHFIRLFSSLVIINLFNFFLGFKTKDPMSGFFIFKKKIYKKNNDYFNKGYKILADIIYSKKEYVEINDIKINFKKRIYGKSKINFKVLLYLIIFILRKL